MPAMIKKSLLIFSEAVVVFIVRRGKRSPDGVKLGISRPAILEDYGRPVLDVGFGLRPALELQQGLPFGGAKRDVRARR
jgi:hypothetical protein